MSKKKRPQHVNFNDLVQVDGYGARLFYVDCWTVEHVYFPTETYTEVWYDLTDAHTGEYQLAEAEDVTKVCDAKQADDYLKNASSPTDDKPEERPQPNKPNAFDNIIGKGGASMYGFGGEYSKKPERQPSARELSAQEAERRKQARKDRAKRVDELLDEYADYKRLADEFGDEEYKAKVEYIGLKLAEISAEGER